MNNQDYIYYASNPKIMRLVLDFHEQLSILIAETREQERIQQEFMNQLESEINKGYKEIAKWIKQKDK